MQRVEHERDGSLGDVARFEEEEEQRALAQEQVVAQVEQRCATATDFVSLHAVHGLCECDAVPALQLRLCVRVEPLWRVCQDQERNEVNERNM